MKTQTIPADLVSIAAGQVQEKEQAGQSFQAAMVLVEEKNSDAAESLVKEEIFETSFLSYHELNAGKGMMDETELESNPAETLKASEEEDTEIDSEEIPWFNMESFRFSEIIDKQLPALMTTSREKLDSSSGGKGVLLTQSLSVDAGKMVNGETAASLLDLVESIENQEDALQKTVLKKEDLIRIVALLDKAETKAVVRGQASGVIKADQTKEENSLDSLVNKSSESIDGRTATQNTFPQMEINTKTEWVNRLVEQSETEVQNLDVRRGAAAPRVLDLTQIGQLNQMHLLQSGPQVESVKIVPQEQWLQKIETFIVDETAGTQTVEKVITTRIQLTPKHLGQMEMELVIKDGGLTAKLVVEELETKQWLEHKLTQLTNTLAARDIKVEKFHVMVAGDISSALDASFDGNSAFKQENEAKKQGKLHHKKLEEELIDVINEEINRSARGHLSMWV